jgi:hypothetical protein
LIWFGNNWLRHTPPRKILKMKDCTCSVDEFEPTSKGFAQRDAGIIVPCMSGSPIISDDGLAVSVVALDCDAQEWQAEPNLPRVLPGVDDEIEIIGLSFPTLAI